MGGSGGFPATVFLLLHVIAPPLFQLGTERF
jgi:hypothetical protein